jgi:hypothetical protein
MMRRRRTVTIADIDAAYIRLLKNGRRTVDWRMLYWALYGRYPDGYDRKFVAKVVKWAKARGLAARRRGNRYFWTLR